MKIAISGKGGVGKTSLTALLAQIYADRGREVLAVDSDPSPSLANALAFPDELLAKLRPISEMEALIEERTGAKPGAAAGFFTINPRVDDLPDRFSAVHGGVRLLEMGSVEVGRLGLYLPGERHAQDLVHALALPQGRRLADGHVRRGGAPRPGHRRFRRRDASGGRAHPTQPDYGETDQEAGRRHRPEAHMVGGEPDPESRGREIPRAGGGRSSLCLVTFPTIRVSSKRIARAHPSTLRYLR